jgi:hypothetical protein
MVEIESEPQVIDNLPMQGLLEGPFVFEKKGIYYLTYPHVANKIEQLEYATSTSPMGPFTQKGVILDESESGCWTVHHSLVEYKGQWYLFYHEHLALLRQEPFGQGRQVSLRPTGLSARYADARGRPGGGASETWSTATRRAKVLIFLDDANPQTGWKTTFKAAKSGAFNEVDFGRGGRKSIEV